MNKILSLCMERFPQFDWTIDIHDSECFETTVTGSFGPFNTIDVLSDNGRHVIVSEIGGDSKTDKECYDYNLNQALDDLAKKFHTEQNAWDRLLNLNGEYYGS
jgi:hypothetical protein